jgi:FtsP/CotA-like multicopper oxidase with cupredoxin domain
MTLKRGQSCVLELVNETAWHHPIHLHGHVFRILPGNRLGDTVLLEPKGRAEIAFVADNPGDWMFHCHVLEHQATGMMALVRVA